MLKEGNTPVSVDDFGGRCVTLPQGLLQGSLQVLQLPPAVQNLHLGKQELLKVCCFCPLVGWLEPQMWSLFAETKNSRPLLPRSLERKKQRPSVTSESVSALSSFGCVNSASCGDAGGRSEPKQLFLTPFLSSTGTAER